MRNERNEKNAKLRMMGEDTIPETEACGITIQKIDPITLPDIPHPESGLPDIQVQHGGILEAPLLPKSDKTGLNKINNAVSSALGRSIALGTASYVTDAGFISELLPDSTVVVYGPGKIFEQGAHGVNEYMERRQMKEAMEGNIGLVEAFCQGQKQAKAGAIR